ncbi:MAG TPA: PKD domain-containing protein, partial [Bacteroidia bacterium]
TNPHDNSGSLSYIRIEFAGVAFSPNNEINGLTLCGVGDATNIDHIQVSFSGDDSYEFFGGTVNAKYLVAFRGWDDDFDTDNGFSGHIQFGFALRDPFAADQSGSKSFESDSYQSGTKTGLAGDTTGLTKPVFSNMTIIGPLVSPTSTAYDQQFVSALHFRRGTACSIFNSVIAGYPAGILFDESSSGFGSTVRNYDVLGSAGDSIGQIRNNIVCGMPTTNTPTRKELEYVVDGARSLTSTSTEGDTTNGVNNSPTPPFSPWVGPFNYFYDNPNRNYTWPHDPGTLNYGNRIYATEQNGVKLGNPFNLTAPNPVPTSISPVCYNSKSLPAYVVTHYQQCCGQSDHFGNTNKYPFNPLLPINTDTSNFFQNYNAPFDKPGWNSGRLQGGFFTQVNYIGAFAGTQTTNDNWTNGWCNFDPQNTDYSGTAAPLANITPSGTQQICPNGGSVVLTANSGNGYTYQWQLNNANINGATNQSYTATQAGTYNVIVSNATGCSAASTSVTVSLLPAPTANITAGGPVTFCQGGSVNLTASANSSYQWSNGGVSQTINVTASGTYFVTVTDANGCTATSSNTAVTVNPLPNATITAGGPTTFCTGDSVQLCANTSSSYMWSNNATTQCIYATQSGSFIVQVTDANGCTSNASPSMSVSVGSSPTPTISANGPVNICQGDNVVLTCNTTANSYSWSNGATTQSITVTASGTYNCTVTNTNACNGVGTSNSINVTVSAVPTAGFTFSGTVPTIVFSSGTSVGATNFMWDFGDQNSSSAPNPTHTYATNGVYTVCLIASNTAGCSDTICQNVNINTGIAPLQADNLTTVSLYPNPLNDQATLEFELDGNAQVSIVLFGIDGKVMFSREGSFDSGVNKVNIDAGQIPAGIYFTRITTNEVTKTIKTIIVK